MIQVPILTVIVLVLNDNPHAEVVGQSKHADLNNGERFVECPGGVLLSSSICIPYGYRKGELPKIPLEIHAAIEVENIREIDDKKMTVSLEFHPQFVWSDDRIVTNFTDYEKKKGKVMNNINIEKLWKPDLLIENLCEFKLHSVLGDVSGLFIGNGLVLGLKNETIVWYEFSAKASIYCNFDFFRYPMDKQECNFTIGTTYPSKRTVIFTYHSSVFRFGKDTQSTDDFNINILTIDPDLYNFTRFGFTIKMNRAYNLLFCNATFHVSRLSL